MPYINVYNSNQSYDANAYFAVPVAGNGLVHCGMREFETHVPISHDEPQFVNATYAYTCTYVYGVYRSTDSFPRDIYDKMLEANGVPILEASTCKEVGYPVHISKFPVELYPLKK